MYAIIRDRGNQHRVATGEVVTLDHMPAANDGDALEFTEVLLTSDGEGSVKVGSPTVENAKVTAQVVEATHKGKKLDIVHFRRRKDSMSKVGHRQKYTRVKIDAIEAGS